MLNFSMYQSGVDFKCPYSNRPFKPLTPLNRLMLGSFSGTGLYLVCTLSYEFCC
jgi:hypothetical protein